jgi:hypothetical protein
VVSLDANASMNQSPVFDMFHYHSAHCGAQARHTTEPIDGIWLSTALDLVAGGELPRPSDHTIATVTLNLKVQAVPGHRWRFTQVRKLDHTAPKPEGAGSWTQVATSDEEWLQAKQNVDQAWDVWSRDAEKLLIQQKQLTSRQPERLLGTIPKAVTGSHKLAPQESSEIRQLRRHLRRLDEVLFLTRRGSCDVVASSAQASSVDWCGFGYWCLWYR